MMLRKHFLDFFFQTQGRKLDLVLVRVVHTYGSTFCKKGDIMLFDSELNFVGCLGGPKLILQLTQQSQIALREKALQAFTNPSNNQWHGESTFQITPYFFVNQYEGLKSILDSVFHLAIFGSGEHLLPFLKLTHLMGYHCTLIDTNLSQDYQTDRMISLQDSLDIFNLDLSPYQGAVILSHHPQKDQNYLQALSQTSIPYIGIMGNARSLQHLLKELNLSDDPRIFAPIGIALGKGDAYTLALSICAQIEQIKNHLHSSNY